MPRANAVIAEVREVTGHVTVAADERAGRVPVQHRRVIFGGGQSGLLDMSLNRSKIWAEVLESLRNSGQPAYVEIDPDSNLITELLLPIRFFVGAVEPTDEGVEVDLIVSQARHYLRASNQQFEELRRLLETARDTRTPVVVTETIDDHEIIDVRPTGEGPADEGLFLPGQG
jgi:hypothetical protein